MPCLSHHCASTPPAVSSVSRHTSTARPSTTRCSIPLFPLRHHTRHQADQALAHRSAGGASGLAERLGLGERSHRGHRARASSASIDISSAHGCSGKKDGTPLTRRLVQGYVYRASRRAKLEHGGLHILRHTFCSHLAMRGAPARAIQELAGHQDLSTTQRYMHLSPAAIEGAIRLLDQPVPGKKSGEDTSSRKGDIRNVLS